MSFFVLWNTKKVILKNVGSQTFLVPIHFHSSTKNTMDVNWNQNCFSNVLFCVPLSKETHRFGKTWGRVNDDRLFKELALNALRTKKYIQKLITLITVGWLWLGQAHITIQKDIALIYTFYIIINIFMQYLVFFWVCAYQEPEWASGVTAGISASLCGSGMGP